MHIVQIYHNRVPVARYGGMERVIVSLCQGLLEAGHKVTLISFRGDFTLKGINHLHLDHFPTMQEAEKRYVELIPSDADILHFHLPHMVANAPMKSVVTMHGNLRAEESPESLPQNTIFISRDHAQRHGRKYFVYNGLNPQDIPCGKISTAQRLYFAFLGRASLKRKGLHNAIWLSRQLKTPLHIGGGTGLPWFGRKYLGQVDDQQKYKLLSEAKALLFPIEWEEPFGLVMIEAMFCGSPVFALSRGSVPEILGLPGSEGLFVHGKTKEELLTLISHHHSPENPQTYRTYAQQYFGHMTMAENYLSFYRREKL